MSKSISLPPAFVQRMEAQLGKDYNAFHEALSSTTPTSIRLNANKPFVASEVLNLANNVAWCPTAHYLTERPVFTTDPLFHGGGYYVQEASSMFLDFVIKTLKLDAKPLVALDLCAAPGGKSTLLLSALHEDSLLVANETIHSRAGILQENMIRWGHANVMITNNDPSDFEVLTDFFDLIVVDAPCSGEGMFRKDENAINEWNEDLVQLCTSRQNRILDNIIKALKPGGTLIYSTCTFGVEENENQLERLVKNNDLLSIKLTTPAEWGITQTEENEIFGYRFYPHLTRGEGLFMGVLQKPQATEKEHNNRPFKIPLANKIDTETVKKWLKPDANLSITQHKDQINLWPRAQEQAIMWLYMHKLRIRSVGILAGQIMKGELVPEHPLAMSHALSKDLNTVELKYEDAMQYLRKNEVKPPEGSIKGWNLMTYNRLALGWAKVLQNRINNAYPTNWRVLKY